MFRGSTAATWFPAASYAYVYVPWVGSPAPSVRAVSRFRASYVLAVTTGRAAVGVFGASPVVADTWFPAASYAYVARVASGWPSPRVSWVRRLRWSNWEVVTAGWA